MTQFEKLEVWRRAVSLSVDVYTRTQGLKDFGFRDQITRSFLSIPSNIAEGLERSSTADKLRFLDYARASCAEARTQSIIGNRVGFIPDDAFVYWVNETRELGAMLRGLASSIENRSIKEASSHYAFN